MAQVRVGSQHTDQAYLVAILRGGGWVQLQSSPEPGSQLGSTDVALQDDGSLFSPCFSFCQSIF